jgi:hypothetical protein
MICVTALRWIEEALRHWQVANPGMYDSNAHPLELWSGPALAMFV